MTGRTTDPFERRLTDAFHAEALPAAPASLRDSLEDIVDLPVVASGRPDRRGNSGGMLGMLGIAAVLLVGGALAIGIGSRPSPSLPASADSTDDVLGSAPPPVVLTYELAWTPEVPASAAVLDDAVRIVQARLDAASGAGTVVAADGPDRLQVHVPAGVDLSRFRQLIGQRGLAAFVPLGTTPMDTGDVVDLETFLPLFGSDGVTDAAMSTNDSGQRVVNFTLSPVAAGLFRDYTADHIGQYFAIVVDGRVLSAPVINSAIPGGEVQIEQGGTEGGLPLDDASILVAILDSGPLPVALNEVGGGLQPVASSSPPAAVATEAANPSASPEVICEPPLDVEGAQLGCNEAIQEAFTVLSVDHPEITRIEFFHACNDVGIVVQDCFVQMFGRVTFTFGDGSPPVYVGLSIGSSPRIIPDPTR